MSTRLAAAALLTILLSGCAGRSVATYPPAPQPPPAPVLPALPPPVPAPPPAPVAPPPPSQPLVDLGGKVNVALLLPLSGGSSVLGQDMLDAAGLALADLASDDMALTPKDTKGTAEGAADAARQAVAEGAKLIIGPLTGGETEAVKPIAQAAGINVISFSTLSRVAGGGVFIMGFTPQQELQRLAAYARGTGIQHFAVLAPSNTYGQVATEAFKAAVLANGGTLDDLAYYDPRNGDYRSAITQIAKGGHFQFTGLLLPESDAERLKAVAALLPGASIDSPNVRLLGTGVWDTPKLSKEPSLSGGWYAAASPEARAGFEQRFAAAYGHSPLRLATLAYDAVGVASVLQRAPGGSFGVPALTNPSGFAGADGIFRLLPDGSTERGLAILQVDSGSVSVVQPAPESFAPAGQ